MIKLPHGILPRTGLFTRLLIAMGGLYLFGMLAVWGAWVYVWRGGSAFRTWLIDRIEFGTRP